MYKRLIVIPFIFFATILFAAEHVYITAYSAVLMNPWNKRIIYSRNPHIKLAPASTAKIMTAIVVARNSSLDKKVKVSAKAASMPPSKTQLKKGEEYKTGDLLKALLLNSGNDASVALAESVAGSEEAFVKMMNDMAKKIGARHTNFKTSSGLPAKNQYSTAYDLTLIMCEAMKYKSIVDIMKMKTAQIREENTDRCIKLKNHNKSLHRNSVYFILGKTGYTRRAGHCFAGYINYGRRNTIVVILKSRKMWMDLARLAIKGGCY